MVIYLNHNWLVAQDGALQRHPEGKYTEDLAPLASRLVQATPQLKRSFLETATSLPQN